MDLKQLGEFGLIHKINKKFSRNLPSHIQGIGDDCAVISDPSGLSQLITTDMLIEDIHFLRRDIAPKDLGYKSLAVNLSDIAAMGGRPQYAFLSIAFPSDIEARWVEEFFDGFYELANKENVWLLGGDTNRTLQNICINVTVIGEVESRFLKKRSTAKVGDIICVTDYLGDSAGGLQFILKPLTRDADATHLLQKHYRPIPHVAQGQWLSQHQAVHAMMDVSDGMHSDLKHILERSQCGARVEVEKLPISQSLSKVALTHNFDATKFALAGGEDYCLLLTVAAESYQELSVGFQKQFGTGLYAIGTMNNTQQLSYSLHGKPYLLTGTGYDHFKAADPSA